MKKYFSIIALLLVIAGLVGYIVVFTASGGPLAPEIPLIIDTAQPRVEITLDFGRQAGMASNQFAVWMADADGRLVKTLYVTRYTARGGWKARKESLPRWVADSGVAQAPAAAIDAVSGATPSSRKVRYVWYCDDEAGKPVPPGKYTVVVEASLRWENRALFQAMVDTSGASVTVKPAPDYFGNSAAERGMVTNVAVQWFAED
ncbi:MAG: DUF2271 domain-containing protein [Planctomycetes bacterium]|nr:DUF2271 domain-containing protein [Planctomycetota bacterium]